jgi:hypothetical protein
MIMAHESVEHSSPSLPAKSAGPPGKRRRRLYEWKTWIITILALLVVSELSLRLVLGLGRPVLYQADSACGYLPVPNRSTRRFFCLNEINSQSMRSPAITEPKPAGEFRLMLIGDSVTYGTTHVDQSKIFASLLRRDLPEIMGRPVEVLNASTGAWAPENEWGYLRSRGTFDSDEVAFVINTGDLDQPFNPGSLGPATGYPAHDPPLAMEELFVRYILPRVHHTSAPVDAGAAAAAEFDANAANHVLDSLAAAAAFARHRNAGFAIIYCGWPGPQWSTDAYRAAFDRLKGWAAEHRVPVIDTSPYLAARPASEVFQDGMHLRALGNELMTHAIEDHFRELSPGAARAPLPASSPSEMRP